MILFISVIVFASMNGATCDYKCLCNYNTEKTVYTSPSTVGNVLGYMYEFDCKPVSGSSRTDGWLMIAFEHKLGYVDNDAQLQIQTCPGSIPDEDKLPTTTTTTTTTTTQTTPYHSESTATTTTDLLTTNATSNIPITSPSSAETTTYLTSSAVSSLNSASSTVSTTMFMTSQGTNMSTFSEKTTLNSTKVQFTSTQTSVTTGATVGQNLTTSPLPVVQTNMPTDTTVTQNVTTSTVPVTKATSTQTAKPTTGTNNPYTSPTVVTTETTATKKPLTTDVLSSTTSNVLQTVTSTQKTVLTTTRPLQGRTDLCPMNIQSEANDKSGTTLAQYGNKCYEIVQNKVSWTHAEIICQTNKGHLVDIGSQQEQEFLYGFLAKIKSHTVWLGLHDRNYEEYFVWTSGRPVTYTNWKAGRKDLYHRDYDCVYMTVNGTWDDIKCGSDNPSTEQQHSFLLHSYVCQYAARNPLDGEVNSCPQTLHVQAAKDHGILGHYGDSCYELVPNVSIAWQHAEDVCQSRSGNLAYIKSPAEQSFILGYIRRHSPNTSVWIGLTDTDSEGHFKWTSGENAGYTNWIPGHTNSERKDCVVFIPNKNGQWDNTECGVSHHYVSDGGKTHPLLCQYKTSGGAPIIG